MSNGSKKEYLQEIKKRYFSVCKSEKSVILDEFCRYVIITGNMLSGLSLKSRQSITEEKGDLTSIIVQLSSPS